MAGLWTYLLPTQYGNNPRVAILFRAIGGEGVRQFTMDEINKEGRKNILKRNIGMRPMKVNNEWIKMLVSGILGSATGTVYEPYTQGDLNELLCMFINSNEVAFNGVTFTTKGFIETFKQYNKMLNYNDNTILEYCKRK